MMPLKTRSLAKCRPGKIHSILTFRKWPLEAEEIRFDSRWIKCGSPRERPHNVQHTFKTGRGDEILRTARGTWKYETASNRNAFSSRVRPMLFKYEHKLLHHFSGECLIILWAALLRLGQPTRRKPCAKYCVLERGRVPHKILQENTTRQQHRPWAERTVPNAVRLGEPSMLRRWSPSGTRWRFGAGTGNKTRT